MHVFARLLPLLLVGPGLLAVEDEHPAKRRRTVAAAPAEPGPVVPAPFNPATVGAAARMEGQGPARLPTVLFQDIAGYLGAQEASRTLFQLSRAHYHTAATRSRWQAVRLGDPTPVVVDHHREAAAGGPRDLSGHRTLELHNFVPGSEAWLALPARMPHVKSLTVHCAEIRVDQARMWLDRCPDLERLCLVTKELRPGEFPDAAAAPAAVAPAAPAPVAPVLALSVVNPGDVSMGVAGVDLRPLVAGRRLTRLEVPLLSVAEACLGTYGPNINAILRDQALNLEAVHLNHHDVDRTEARNFMERLAACPRLTEVALIDYHGSGALGTDDLLRLLEGGPGLTRLTLRDVDFASSPAVTGALPTSLEHLETDTEIRDPDGPERVSPCFLAALTRLDRLRSLSLNWVEGRHLADQLLEQLRVHPSLRQCRLTMNDHEDHEGDEDFDAWAVRWMAVYREAGKALTLTS